MKPVLEMDAHPLAEMFPHMSEVQYRAFVADIAENGVNQRVVVLDEMILDGRSRCKACLELGIRPPYRRYNEKKEGDPKQFSIMKNLIRRDLTKSQRAMIIVRKGLAQPPKGYNLPTAENALGIREAAVRYGVNHLTVYKAFWVLSQDESLAEEVFRGSISVGGAELKIHAEKRRREAAKRKPPPTSTRRKREQVAARPTAKKQGLDAHPIAKLMPAMSEAEYQALKMDIDEIGLIKPITLYQGKILDGRYRYRACVELGIKPKLKEFEGTEEEAQLFSLQMNLIRQHISSTQKAMYVVREQLTEVGTKGSGSVQKAAKRYGVSVQTLYKVARVNKHDPKLGERVLNGELGLGEAERLIRAA